MAGSPRWASFRIMIGTILGGALGFYVMHRLELSYKEKMKQRMIQYEREMKRREELLSLQQEGQTQLELLSDS